MIKGLVGLFCFIIGIVPLEPHLMIFGGVLILWDEICTTHDNQKKITDNQDLLWREITVVQDELQKAKKND